jgi:hypothetical protein
LLSLHLCYDNESNQRAAGTWETFMRISEKPI